jgi:hypothetical protein
MNASRQSPRKIVNRILCIQMEPNIQAIVQNISDDGLGFHALTPLTQSGAIHFSFAENGQRTEASGELVWIDSQKKTGGLRFTSLTRAGRERMRNWVDQAAGPPNAGVSEPATPRSRETSFSDVAAPRSNAGPAPYVPPLGAPSIQPDMPGFALLEADPHHLPYTWDQEMALQNSRPRFFTGFVTGAIITAILAAAWFFVYGNPAELLAQWKARTASSPPTQSTGAAPPPVQAPPTTQAPPGAALPAEADPFASPSQGLPASGGVEGPATRGTAPGATDESQRGSAAVQVPPAPPVAAETPSANSAAGDALKNMAPKSADNGEAEFTQAERYLRDKSPGNSVAAANSLWAAVKKGNISAEIALANLYARGDGVTKNCDQARILLRAAAEKGSSMASQELAQVVRGGCR